MVEKNFNRFSPAETFSGASVDLAGNSIDFILRSFAEITAFREIETKNTVCVLIGTALPGLMRFSKVYRRIQFVLHGVELSKLRAIIQTDAAYRTTPKRLQKSTFCLQSIPAF